MSTEPRERWRPRLLPSVLSLAVVVIIFIVVLPQIADFSDVWRTLVEMTGIETLTLVLVAGWNLVTYWLLLMVVLPELRFAQAMVVTETSTAIANTLPGGPAFGLGTAYSMYASWGFSRARIALALVVSGVGDLFAKLLMPVLALVALAVYGDASASLVIASVVGVATLAVAVTLFVVALSSDDAARKVGDGVGRGASRILALLRRAPVAGWDQGLARFRAETVDVLRARWGLLLGTALLSHASLYLVLLLALRHVGISDDEVGWAEVLGAFAFVRLLSAVPITPGGLGVVELGLTAALVVAGGAEDQVVAAVLVFRMLTYLVQIPFGALTYLYWSHNRSWRRPPLDRRPDSTAIDNPA
ncbi:MAG: lysylphosphatidylglycerol synthase transmembrane domain-containing protein [Actinomycetota bacterium]